tara:strand:- start:1588 stop:2043 length:456 start_codon:yes stop_codon:yes gene_type:complete
MVGKFEEIRTTDEFTVPLSLAELLFLSDNITALVMASDYEGSASLRSRLPAAVVAVPFPLMEKILFAIHHLLSVVKTTEYATTHDVMFSPADLFVLREAAFSRAQYGKYPVGLTLLKKICGILYDEQVPDIDLEALEKLLKDVEGLEDGTA